MKEAKHTPGEWQFENCDTGWFIVVGDGTKEKYIADVHRHVRESKDDARDEANAKLIAAAPELLECLADAVLPFLKKQGLAANGPRMCVEHVITKATA